MVETTVKMWEAVLRKTGAFEMHTSPYEIDNVLINQVPFLTPEKEPTARTKARWAPESSNWAPLDRTAPGSPVLVLEEAGCRIQSATRYSQLSKNTFLHAFFDF